MFVVVAVRVRVATPDLQAIAQLLAGDERHAIVRRAGEAVLVARIDVPHHHRVAAGSHALHLRRPARLGAVEEIPVADRVELRLGRGVVGVGDPAGHIEPVTGAIRNSDRRSMARKRYGRVGGKVAIDEHRVHVLHRLLADVIARVGAPDEYAQLAVVEPLQPVRVTHDPATIVEGVHRVDQRADLRADRRSGVASHRIAKLPGHDQHTAVRRAAAHQRPRRT